MSQDRTQALPIGIGVTRPSPRTIIDAVVQAEEDGLPAVWSTVVGTFPDAVTSLALAAARTQRVTLGTSIVPVYPRHPVTLASQALVFADLAPGRFRLGMGPSHRPTVEGMFGLPMERPLAYMREYLAVIRGLLWEGRSDFEGEFFRVHAGIPSDMAPPRTPLLLSALRANAFRQAGEISDGAISWVCPVPYLVETAIPALREGAEAAGREQPPLVAHVPMALTPDEDAARAAGRDFLGRYARLPFYSAMFADAGFPVGEKGAPSDDLVAEVVVSGDAAQVVKRLRGVLELGPDELLVTLLPVGDANTLQRGLARAVTSAG
jgi:F420-dependent oxidoreductase-like protein